MNHHPLHLDAEYAKSTIYKNIVVAGTYVSSIAVGLSVPDMGAWESEYTRSDIPHVPLTFGLKLNYPNPFNPDIKILYSPPVNCDVNLSVYNIKGQKVKTLIKEKQEKEHHSIVCNGKDNSGKTVSSGINFYKLKVKSKTNQFTKVLKMMMLK